MLTLGSVGGVVCAYGIVQNNWAVDSAAGDEMMRHVSSLELACQTIDQRIDPQMPFPPI